MMALLKPLGSRDGSRENAKLSAAYRPSCYGK